MIRVAIDKGLRDMEVNAGRGIRNLLDLGTYFSKGQDQKNFFAQAQKIMNNKNSRYYTLIRRLIHNVDHKIIKTFGINLGYNSLIYGAGIIKEREKEYGFNIPWPIIFDLRSLNDVISISDIAETLSCGESLGIYCGMFFIDNDKDYLQELIKTLATYKESAYFLFVPPKILTDEIAIEAVEAGNIAIIFQLPAPAESFEDLETAANTLLKHKCLFGIYSLYDANNLAYITSNGYVKLIEDLNSTFAFLIKKSTLKNEKRFLSSLTDTRSAEGFPFLFIDFYNDLASINELISGQNPFLTIKANGSIDFKLIDTPAEDLNIKRHSLPTILERLLPRTQYV